MGAQNIKNTKVYQKAFMLAMQIYSVSKNFPREETYSLTDQLRRSPRSVCACLGEAFRKKKYPAYFVSKLTDSDMENSETGVWLDFALACKYISPETYKELLALNEEIGRMLNHIICNPEKY
jgi:four helix bundle protein